MFLMAPLMESLIAWRARAYHSSCAWLRENRAAFIFVILAGVATGTVFLMTRSAGALFSAASITYEAYVLLLVASLFFALPNYTVRYWADLKVAGASKAELDEIERQQGNESAEFAAFGILLLIVGFAYQVILLRGG